MLTVGFGPNLDYIAGRLDVRTRPSAPQNHESSLAAPLWTLECTNCLICRVCLQLGMRSRQRVLGSIPLKSFQEYSDFWTSLRPPRWPCLANQGNHLSIC